MIELLVVVAVISVLAALLLPSLSKAKQKAEAVSCLNNLRQNNIACQMYADDELGWFPLTGRFTVNWMVKIHGYLGEARTNLDTKVRDTRSPARLYPTLDCPTHPIDKVWGSYPYGNYSYNMHSTTRWPTGNPNYEYVRARDAFPNPESTILIWDGYYVVPDSWGMIAAGARPSATGKSDRYHQGYSLNFVFVDGSAQNLRAGQRTDLELANSRTRNKVHRGWTGLE